jgi:hypothetical protein
MQHLRVSAATVTASTGRLSGWKMRRARNGRKTMDDITYMDCWLYIAPLIPIKADTYSKDVYVMTFRALKEAEERRVKENDVE